MHINLMNRTSLLNEKEVSGIIPVKNPLRIQKRLAQAQGARGRKK